jgi:hypothetical protein
MRNMFKHPSGNIALAMLMMVVATMSGLTLSSLAMRDIVAFQYDYEGFQGMILLRSEAYRGQKIAQRMGSVLIPIRTSERTVELSNSAMRKSFKIQSLLSKGGNLTIQDEVVMGDQKQMTQVASLVKCKTGTGQTAMMNTRFSMIRKYGIYTLASETFAKFMYFTDTDESSNETPVYFHGPDLVYGRVHSNSDIWIKKTTGGVNDGWPIFYGWVSTNGEVKSFSGAYQVDDVFPGGLSEGYGEVLFPEEAQRIRSSGNIVGPLYYDVNNIMFVEVDGPSFTTYKGTIQDPIRQYFDVYNNYPPGDPPMLYRNQYGIRDTIWTLYTNGSSYNRSQFVNGKLWIRGTFGSYQTWGSADTMFLIGDILLSSTTRGQDPVSNRADVIGLVSEKSIVVKYGYRDPQDSLRYHRNCGADGSAPNYGGIMIYAAMCALGDGHGNPRADGVFTFEYQHPHPSVPDVLINNVLYTKIDLHRRHFPQTGGYPWPENPPVDFPWYNPLWPERTPYLERGYISIYGSVSQRRRGFVHRSYDDAEWPPPSNPPNISWNQPMDFCGGSSSTAVTAHNDAVLGIPLGCVDYPGTSSPTGTGYKKNYHYDTRFYRTSPIDYPEVNRRDETPFEAVNWVIKRPPENL